MSFHFYKEIWHYWRVVLLCDSCGRNPQIQFQFWKKFRTYLYQLLKYFWTHYQISMIIIQIVRVLNVLCVYVLCRTWKEFESSSIGSKVDCIHILCYLLCNHFFLLFFPLSSALFYNHHVISKGGKRVWSGIFRTYFHNHFCLFSFIISQWCKNGNN